MRFDLLFDDLEGQLESQLAAESAQQRSEEERLRAARTALRERLSALAGGTAGGIRLHLIDGSTVEFVRATIGRDWLAAELPAGGDWIVPLAAIASVSLDAAQTQASRERMPQAQPPEPGALAAKIGIGVVLRDLARRRVPLDVQTRAESASLHGTIDRIGADHLDLAVHERGVARRQSAVLETRLVPFAALVMVRV